MNDATRVLSVLFANASGNARLHEKLGGSEAKRAVERCLKRMERAIEGFGGRLVKTLGDELMAVFDSADAAFQAASEMQQRVADLPPVSGVKLAIRVGFSHGPVSEDGSGVAGETVKTAAHLAGLARPGQVLTSRQAHDALSPALQGATRDLGTTAFRGTVFEALAPDSAALAAKTAGGAEAGNSGFCLRYAGKLISLDEQQRRITMGRDPDSDVVVGDRRASRHHAQIERRGDSVVLVDKSTNGTFITLPDQAEVFVRHDECMLRGKGMICFAASASSPDADCAQFEQI
jgi:class 3 adenylate cyclase